MLNEKKSVRQRKRSNSDAYDASRTVTLSKSEYHRLKALESSVERYESFKRILLWVVVIIFIVIFLLSLSTVMQDAADKSHNYSTDPIKIYEDELSHLKTSVNKPQSQNAFKKNRRPGRLYHRGGNYGREV